MRKAAQGLSLNTIVIAAIVLVVLVLLIFIFSGRMSSFQKGIKHCDGHCESTMSACLDTENPIHIMNCDDGDGSVEGDYCCVAK